MTTVQRWLVAAIAGLLGAIGIEVATIRALGVREAHALGYGVGVGAFVLVYTYLQLPRGRRDARRAALTGVVAGLVVAVAGWLAGGAVGLAR